MARIFISHSSKDNDKAIELRDWLAANGWDDVFLDLDPQRGIAAGERWRDALRIAVGRCEAVLCLISANWLASAECKSEFTFAKYLGKRIFPILIGPVDFTDLSAEMLTEHQIIDLVRDVHVWDRLKDGLTRAGLDASTFPLPERRKLHPVGRGPYPGLEPLTEDDAAIFFGREAHIVRGLDRLRSLRDQGVARLMVILGASGAGKSSFLRAGLWPRLRRDRAFLPLPVIRPERAVLSGSFGLYRALETAMAAPAIAAALAESPGARDLPRSRAAIRDRIEGDPAGLAALLGALAEAARPPRRADASAAADVPAEGGPPTVLLAIDQGEELFNPDGASESEAFLSLLAATLHTKSPILALIAIRSDAFPLLQNESRLLALPKDTIDLPAMAEGNYRTVIKGPADLVGLKIEPALLEALMRDVGGSKGADALPLLAFTLERLYEQYGADGNLTFAKYESLGGLAGAIGVAMRQLLDNAKKDRRLPQCDIELLPLLRSIFIPHLVRVNEGGEFARRVVALDDLPAAAQALIELLVGQRLLVKDRRQRNSQLATSAASAEIVEVAHEALLREWPQLVQWLREEREFLVWRGQLEFARTQWENAGEHERDAALLTGRILSIAQGWAATRSADLSPADSAFIARSLEVAEQMRIEDERRKLAALRAQSLYLADLADREVESGDAATGALLALEALPKRWPAAKNERPYLPSPEASLYSAVIGLRERTVLAHDIAVQCASFNRYGGRILTGCSDGSVRLWDARNGVMFAALRGHERAIRSAAFNRSATLVVSASADKTVRVWNVDGYRREPVAILRGHEAGVFSAAFSPEYDAIIATASADRTARVWNAESGEVLLVLRTNDPIYFVEFSSDGKRIITASRDRTAELWDAGTGQALRTFRGHEGKVRSAVFNSDNSRIVTASEDGTARIWDVRTGTTLGVLRGHEMPLSFAAFSADGTRVVTASADGTARVWDAKSGAILRSFRGHQSPVNCASFSFDGARIVTASNDTTARVWEVNTGVGPSGAGRDAIVFRGHENSICSAEFDPQGTRILTSSADKTARLWDAGNGQSIAVLRGHEKCVRTAAFSPDGRRIVTASDDGTAGIWDAETAALLVTLKGHTSLVNAATFSPDGDRVATASDDRSARLWDVRTGKVVAEFLGHQDSVTAAAFNADGSRIVTASRDKAARIWDARTSACIAVLDGHNDTVWSAAFSPDGARIVTASWDKTARIWDLRTGACIAILKGHKGSLVRATFSPDGTRILTASSDGEAKLWDARFGAALAVLRGSGNAISFAAFSPDGARIVTTFDDNTARVWPVFRTTKDLIDYAHTVLPRKLTPEQRKKYHLDVE